MGVFTVAQVLWLIEEIERKDRIIEALADARSDDWVIRSAESITDVTKT